MNECHFGVRTPAGLHYNYVPESGVYFSSFKKESSQVFTKTNSRNYLFKDNTRCFERAYWHLSLWFLTFLKKKRSAWRDTGLTDNPWTGYAGVTGTSGATCRNQQPLIGSQAFNTLSSIVLGLAPIFKRLKCSRLVFVSELTWDQLGGLVPSG